MNDKPFFKDLISKFPGLKDLYLDAMRQFEIPLLSSFFIRSEFRIIYLKINKKSRYDIKCGISCLAGEKWKDISSRERKGLKEKLK